MKIFAGAFSATAHGGQTSKGIIIIHVGQTRFLSSIGELLRSSKLSLTLTDFFLSENRIFFFLVVCGLVTIDVLDVDCGLGL